MTKHIYSVERGWEVELDPETNKDATAPAAPLSVLQEPEHKQLPLEELIPLLPFEKVLNDHLIVRIDKYRRPKGVRIHRPDNAQGAPTRGDCVAIAENLKDIKVGDKILYSQFAGYLLVFEGLPNFRVIGYSEVLSILKKDAPDLLMEGA